MGKIKNKDKVGQESGSSRAIGSIAKNAGGNPPSQVKIVRSTHGITLTAVGATGSPTGKSKGRGAAVVAAEEVTPVQPPTEKKPVKRILKYKYERAQQQQKDAEGSKQKKPEQEGKKEKREVAKKSVKLEIVESKKVLLPSTSTSVKSGEKKSVEKASQEVSPYDMEDEEVGVFTIHSLYQEMRESCVISDRWCIPEPMWDSHTGCDVLLCYEVDVLLDGSVRMKRCIKILDTFEVLVLLDGSDKTYLFKEKHPTIKSSLELCDLIRKVTMVKVCSGIKDCDPTEFDNMSVKVIERAGCWYSSECNVEVEKGCLGNICRKCTSLRNTLRRKMRRQFGLDNGSTTNGNNTASPRTLLSSSIKPVLRSVGEALYTNLKHMTGMTQLQKSSQEEILISAPTQPPPPRSSSEQVLHPELKIYMNSELKQRLDEIASQPPTLKFEHIVEFDPRTMTKTLKRIQSPITSFRNALSSSSSFGGRGAKRAKTDNQNFVLGNNGELTLVTTPSGETIQLPEGFVLADESQWGDNVIVQKLEGSGHEDQFILGDDNSIIVGSNFTLEDGEEYEVIGEAPSSDDNIQLLPMGNDSNIEIIEVDENMIQLVDEHNQPEIQPVDPNSDIFKFLQAHRSLQGV